MKKLASFFISCSSIFIFALSATAHNQVVVVPINSKDNNSFGVSYAKVAIVAKAGGNYSDPLEAMNDTSTWCGVPNANNPCLLRLMPGRYDLGDSQLQMQEYIDIEGSGETTTTIKSNISNFDDESSATLLGANNAEIRNITIKNTGGGNYSYGIFNSHSSPNITNVKVEASNGSTRISAIKNSYSSPLMTNVKATSFGDFSYSNGIENSHSSPKMINVAAVSTGNGDYNTAIRNVYSSPVIMNTQATVIGDGLAKYGIFNGYSSSPELIDVLVTVSGSDSNIGIKNYMSASPTLLNVKVTSIGGSSTYGMENVESTIKMTNVEITATEGKFITIGINNIATSSLNMSNAKIIASGDIYNLAIQNADSSSSAITNSEIRSTCVGASNCDVGDTHSIHNGDNTTASVGSTLLEGPVFAGSGSSFTCVGAYNQLFEALDSNCN